MTRDELIEIMARAIYAKKGFVYTEADEPERMFDPIKWEDADDDGYQCIRDGFRQEAAAALTAIEAAGLAIVPVEATNAMICAGVSERHIRRVPFAWNKATVSVYRAMIEAGRI